MHDKTEFTTFTEFKCPFNGTPNTQCHCECDCRACAYAEDLWSDTFNMYCKSCASLLRHGVCNFKQAGKE